MSIFKKTSYLLILVIFSSVALAQTPPPVQSTWLYKYYHNEDLPENLWVTKIKSAESLGRLESKVLNAGGPCTFCAYRTAETFETGEVSNYLLSTNFANKSYKMIDGLSKSMNVKFARIGLPNSLEVTDFLTDNLGVGDHAILTYVDPNLMKNGIRIGHSINIMNSSGEINTFESQTQKILPLDTYFQRAENGQISIALEEKMSIDIPIRPNRLYSIPQGSYVIHNNRLRIFEQSEDVTSESLENAMARGCLAPQ